MSSNMEKAQKTIPEHLGSSMDLETETVVRNPKKALKGSQDCRMLLWVPPRWPAEPQVPPRQAYILRYFLPVCLWVGQPTLFTEVKTCGLLCYTNSPQHSRKRPVRGYVELTGIFSSPELMCRDHSAHLHFVFSTLPLEPSHMDSVTQVCLH